MDKKFYALARFDEESQARFETCRQTLVQAGYVGVQTAGLPHHVTLCDFPGRTEADVAALLAAAADEQAPIDVNINALGLFGLRVLFLAPAPNLALTRLAHGLCDDDNWVAHATMLIDEKERVTAAVPILADAFTPFHARIDCIDLYEFFPSRYIGAFPLRG